MRWPCGSEKVVTGHSKCLTLPELFEISDSETSVTDESLSRLGKVS